MRTIQLAPHGLFNTPQDPKTLTSWIERHNAETKIHLYTLQGMYYNLIVQSLALHDRIEIHHLGRTIVFTRSEA